MSLPEGTIHYAGDHLILAGDITPDQVAACVAAGAKSWLYLNDDCHAKCPKADVQAASLPGAGIWSDFASNTHKHKGLISYMRRYLGTV